MVQMLLIGWLGLTLAVITRGDEPRLRTEPKPQWQRLLTSAEARTAAALEMRIAELEAADNYAEAIRLGEKLFALSTKVQGADHWQTVMVQWQLIALKKVADLPAEKRAGWRQAAQGAAAACRAQPK